MTRSQTAHTGPDRRFPGRLLRVTGDYAWRILAIGTVGYFGIKLLEKLSLAVIPFLAALLVSAVLHPLAVRLRTLGASRWLSTVVTMLTALVVFGGLITIVVVRATQQAPQLGNELNNLLPHLKHWLIHGPLKINPKTVNNLDKTISTDITKNSSKIASTALSTGKTALEVLAGIVLAVFCTVFLVYDGDRIWSYLLKGVPVQGRRQADMAGRAAWRTISYYVRGTFVVAAFHGVVVGITLLLLGVPLALPLGVLVGLGSFVPLVGAVVSGVLAVAVAGLSRGLVAAVIVLAVLLLDNQIEAHLLQPFVVGRYVRIHPLAVVLALAVGGILFGIVGAVVAVPVVATANSAARAALAAAGGGDSNGVGGPAGAGEKPASASENPAGAGEKPAGDGPLDS